MAEQQCWGIFSIPITLLPTWLLILVPDIFILFLLDFGIETFWMVVNGTNCFHHQVEGHQTLLTLISLFCSSCWRTFADYPLPPRALGTKCLPRVTPLERLTLLAWNTIETCSMVTWQQLAFQHQCSMLNGRKLVPFLFRLGWVSLKWTD